MLVDLLVFIFMLVGAVVAAALGTVFIAIIIGLIVAAARTVKEERNKEE